MKINILSILLLLSIIDIAVCQCVEKPHVNPILYWDWRNEGLDTRSEELDGTGSFKFWQLGIDGDRKLKLNFSPFVSTSDQVNTLDFTVLKDYQPKDGWELVYRHFGETIPNVQQANITNNPAFALYNRFSGLLRIFIMTTYNPTAQTAVLELGFYKSGLQQKKSALLSFASDFPAAIEKFDNIISMKALNRAIGCDAPNGCRTWYYGDYYMAYDPCVCSNFSQLYFNLKQNTTTTMVSKTDGFASLVIDEGQVVSNAPNTLIGATSKVYDAWNAGKETSKTATELSEKANSFISDHVEFLSDNGLLSSSSYRKLKGVLDVAGNIGMVIGAANFLYTAFLGTSITGATAYAPQTFRLDYTTNTTSEDILYSGFNAFRVPGSPDGTGFEISGYQKPLYDHVLGVVSLMNSPKLEYAEYETDPVVVGMEWNVFTNSFVPVYKTPPPVREYHLKEDLKLAVNPASGLQITSVEGSFFWDESKLAPEDKNVDFVNSIRPIRHFGPFMLSGIPVSADLPNSCPVLSQPVDPHVSIDKMKLIELSEKSGYEVFLMKKGSSYDESLNRYFVKNVKFKTPNVDILYLRNQTFKLFYNGENPFISVRLNIFMRNNEDLTDKKVYIQTVTYQVLSEDINISSIGSSGLNYYTNGFEYCVSSGNPPSNTTYYDYEILGIDPSPFVNTFQDLPLSITTENQVVGNDLSAVLSIRVKEGTVFVGSFEHPITISALEITVDPNVEIPPYVTIISGYPLAPASNSFIATSSEINSICSGDNYNNRTPISSRMGVSNSVDKIPPVISWSRLGYPIPNPTKSNCQITFDLAEPSGYEMHISNAMGVNVMQLEKRDFASSGKHTINFSTERLEAGVYYISFSSDGFRQARKLVVVK